MPDIPDPRRLSSAHALPNSTSCSPVALSPVSHGISQGAGARCELDLLMAAWCREAAAPPVAEEKLYMAGLWGLARRPPEGEGAPSLYPPSYESE